MGTENNIKNDVEKIDKCVKRYAEIRLGLYDLAKKYMSEQELKHIHKDYLCSPIEIKGKKYNICGLCDLTLNEIEKSKGIKDISKQRSKGKAAQKAISFLISTKEQRQKGILLTCPLNENEAIA